MELVERRRVFRRPSGEFQGKPFWAWNGKLEKEELLRQIDVMKEMGFGGFFMHSRTGLATEYLGDEWFDRIRECAEYGNSRGMEAWLYDEDRWPSGSAGGLVTEVEEFRQKFLEIHWDEGELKDFLGKDCLVAVFACRMREGRICSYRMLSEAEADAWTTGLESLVFVTVEAADNSDNYNGFCYADTMDREATERFIALTHERYRETCGELFADKVQGIFTDEPHRGPCFTEFSGGRLTRIPFTRVLFEEFEKRFGYDLKARLPEVFGRMEGQELSRVTRDYFELTQELFLENFAVPIQKWCREHRLVLTGHVLHEDSLCAQTIMQGSLMRYYEHMDIPGVDVLGEYNTCFWIVKQIASAARQLGKPWVLSELNGCSGWQMNFQSYKNVGDWQALLGVNLRCPHLSWYTMEGEAKRDYPASILHQSAWYQEYAYLEDYFSRIHAALFEGKAECALLVINPVESVWARAYAGAFRGLDAWDPEIKELERKYRQVFSWLMGRQIDFDYGDEDFLARFGCVENGRLRVGEAVYDKVLVAGADTLRMSTVTLLREFCRAGGRVVFAGDVPQYVDAELSEEVTVLAGNAVRIPFEEEALYEACRSGNEVRVTGEGSGSVFVQSRVVEGGRMIMLLNVDRKRNLKGLQVRLGSGESLERWNPRTGEIMDLDVRTEDGCIILPLDLEKGGERIFLVRENGAPVKNGVSVREPGTECAESLENGCAKSGRAKRWKRVEVPEIFAYELSEPNVCVLDMVQADIVSGDTVCSLEQMEVLRADRRVRDFLNIPYRGGEMLQPWYEAKFYGGDKKELCGLTLNFEVEAEICPEHAVLVLEGLEHVKNLYVNGRPVKTVSAGKWIDICFDRLAIPDDVWKIGRNVISIEIGYYKTSGLEAVYLLGDFGVMLESQKRPRLTKKPEKLQIGDISKQGYPFYSGTVRYLFACSGQTKAAVKSFGGALVKLHGSRNGVLAFEPYEGYAEDLTAIEVVLTRRNTFGPLHQRPKIAGAYGPGNFVTGGRQWTNSYQLLRQGLLARPVVWQDAGDKI